MKINNNLPRIVKVHCIPFLTVEIMCVGIEVVLGIKGQPALREYASPESIFKSKTPLRVRECALNADHQLSKPERFGAVKNPHSFIVHVQQLAAIDLFSTRKVGDSFKNLHLDTKIYLNMGRSNSM